MTAVDNKPLDEHPGLRERKKAATRRAIRLSALELFAAKGFSKVTVEDIAEAAEVSPRTFFNYFPSKEATIFGNEPEATEVLLRRLAAEPPSLGPREALRSVLVDWVRSMAEDTEGLGCDLPRVMELMREAAADPAFSAARAAEMAAMERALAQGLAERLGTDKDRDPYPALLASSAVGALKVASFFWANLGGKVPVEALVGAGLQAIVEGLPEQCTLRQIVAEGFEKGEINR